MAYTVTKLITNAYYTTGIVSQDFQDVDGGQIAIGLDLLNEILGDQTVDTGMVPYYSAYNFNSIQGQETYFVPDLIQAVTLVFFLNTVRYEMAPIPFKQYFGSTRPNVQSLPFNWHAERTLNGSNIYLYFFPDAAYPLTLRGLFRLSSVAINQDLLLTLDLFYVSYLKYRLAEKICTSLNYDLPPGVAKEIDRYEGNIRKMSHTMDMSVNVKPMIGTIPSLNYAYVNLGRGFTP